MKSLKSLLAAIALVATAAAPLTARADQHEGVVCPAEPVTVAMSVAYTGEQPVSAKTDAAASLGLRAGIVMSEGPPGTDGNNSVDPEEDPDGLVMSE